MLQLIKTEHALKMNNVSDGEAQYIAETRYSRIKMLLEMSLACRLYGCFPDGSH
jgi:hypothetical protein